VLVVDFDALGGDAGVVERYAGIVGVVLLLPEEVLAPLRQLDLLAVVAAGVGPLVVNLRGDARREVVGYLTRPRRT